MAPRCCGFIFGICGIIFVLSEPVCVKWLYIRLRLESLDDTDDADNSMFVDFAC